MIHESPLVAVIVIGLGLAFGFGTLANRLRLSPLVGYLLAGVLVGPFTPGFIADGNLTLQLAEIGVILLMFGVGLHFSIKDMAAIRAIVIPGALIQVALAVLLGFGAAQLLGWRLSSGLVLGMAMAVASTVVAMRALTDRRQIDTERGRLVVGWLVMQDIITVLALVLIPPFAGIIDGGNIDIGRLFMSLWATLGKLVAFGVLMFFAARRIMPQLLHYIAHTGSRELFRLAVLSVALGVAFIASELFGVSIALGAFLAGMILSDSPLSQRAAEESLPFRDAFAVLFFISVGMLFDPMVIIREPLALTLTVAVVFASAAFATCIARFLGQSWPAALTLGASLAQIGEFSFILADLGVGLHILPKDGRDLILGTSIITIFLNPLVFASLSKIYRRLVPYEQNNEIPQEPLPVEVIPPPTSLTDHVVIIGYGRVGRLLAAALKTKAVPVLVIEDAPDAREYLRKDKFDFIEGNGASQAVLHAANLEHARYLFVAIPEVFEASEVVRQARQINPTLPIIARAHFDEQITDLTEQGASAVVMGERELASAMLGFVRA
ncbi:MAG: YbaL family putative K(+) efflux transporter [Rhizomicrobium sp.]